jgi:hypothetical protein
MLSVTRERTSTCERFAVDFLRIRERFARFTGVVRVRDDDFWFCSSEFRLPARGVVRVLDGSSGADYKI